VGILEGSGAEAVVPLENNRAWLSRLAEDLNDIQVQRGPFQYGNNQDVLVRMNRIIELLESLLGMNICLDSGALVGELAPAMDAQFGKIYGHVTRGRR